MIGTSFCWMRKPTDIRIPTILECGTPISDILLAEEELASQPYKNTPLDFVSRDERLISLHWAYDQNILRKMHLPLFGRMIKVRPINRIPTDNWPSIDTTFAMFAFAFSLAYSAIFVSAWNYPFPSFPEALLWRISSVGTMVLILVTITIERSFFLHQRTREKCIDENVCLEENIGKHVKSSGIQRKLNRMA